MLKRFISATAASAVVVSLAATGCDSGKLKPMATPQEVRAIKTEEKKEEREVLSKLEKKYGPDHPQVKQMKMELSDDPPPKE